MLDKNVLLLESVSQEAHQLLLENAPVLASDSPYSGEEIAHRHNIEAIITRGKGQVNQQLIDACPELKVIARCGVGLDNVDVNHASSKQVKVVNAPGVNADTVAEHAMSLMLSLQRKLFTSFLQVKQHNWDYRKCYDGNEIRGKTLGVLGMGNIGQKVARLAEAFGMDIIYWDLLPKEVLYPFASLEEVLSLADIISIHLPLLPETNLLINKESIEKMRPHTLLVNTARGAIIDEEALTDAIRTQKIGGFGADVLTVEPPPVDYPLLGFENVMISPHSASLTQRTYNEMCVKTVKNTISILKGEAIDPKYIFNVSLLT